MINIIIALMFSTPNYAERIAVEAAYVVTTYKAPDEVGKCCGNCTNGKVIHGDGHVTECPCPKTCLCKRSPALVHPPVMIQGDCKTCLPKR